MTPQEISLLAQMLENLDCDALKSAIDKVIEDSKSRRKEIAFIKESFEYYLSENDVVFRVMESEGRPWSSEDKIRDFLSGINFREMKLMESEAAEALRGVLAMN